MNSPIAEMPSRTGGHAPAGTIGARTGRAVEASETYSRRAGG